jgi:cell division inhibitor SulA
MPQFVIERDFPGASKLSGEQIREGSLKSLEVLRELGPEIQWLHSFVTDDKIYCIYSAPDESLLREHARLTGLPISRVEAVRRLLEPSAFEAQPQT